MPGIAPVVDVVVDAVAVLGEEAEDGEEHLGDVRNRDHQQRPRDVHAPGVVALHVGLLGGQVNALVGEPADPRQVALHHQLGSDRLGGGVDQRARIAGREEVGARVVGEEELGGVEAGGRREGAPRRPLG